MQQYKDKNEFMNEIKKRYELFDNEFNDVKEEERKKLVQDVDRTPQQMLSYQIGWLTLLNSWEKDEKTGKKVVTPAPEYKWNKLGSLYQKFYDMNDKYTLAECREILKKEVEKLFSWMNYLSENELFLPNQRSWTVTNANWEMYKWIHINTVAPFKSFRTKIRKWKKNNTE